MTDALPLISEAAEAIRAGRLDPLELVARCLDRIDRYDPAIHAWVYVDADGARREAERLGRLARKGEWLGPLHGIPLGIKDIVDVQGVPTRAGSPLRADHVARQDAHLVARLRGRGAIFLGKTVTTEFACFDPSPTRNPWNVNHTPGGSSSGSAAAVALQMCMAAIGSQTGGSITRPASYCGVAGLKPTFGVVSTEGVFPVSRHLDHVGPIARRVADVRAVFEVLDERTGQPRASVDPLRQGVRLARVESFFMEEAEASVRAVTRAAFEPLREAWADPPTRPLPDSFADVLRMHLRIMAYEAAQVHRERFAAHRASFGPNLTALIEDGLALSEAAYREALAHQRRFQRDAQALFADGVVAVTPATVTPAPARLDTTGDPRFNSPWSYAGFPTVSIPCGLAPNGMPCGLQFIGPPQGEARLLAMAEWCERRLGFDQQPPAP